MLQRQVQQQSLRPRRLDALRLWIDCSKRAGELGQAQQQIEAMNPGAARLYARALVLLARSAANLPRALSLLARARQRWPDQGEIPYRAAVLLLADHRPAEAHALLQQACRLADTAACSVALAHALLDLGRLTESMAAARRVPDLQPRPRDIKRGRALILRVIKRTQRFPRGVKERYRVALDMLNHKDQAGTCIKAMDEILLDHPRLAVAHTLLGLAHMRLGNRGAAVSSFRRAAGLNPWDATNPYYLGVLYEGQQHPRKAASRYQRALQVDPFHADAASRLGKALLSSARPREAARVLDRLLALDAAAPASLRLAARAHMAARSYQRAERYYARLAGDEPTDFEINLRLAQLLYKRYRRQGNSPAKLLRRAAEHADKAAKVRPNDPELRRLQAVIDTRF